MASVTPEEVFAGLAPKARTTCFARSRPLFTAAFLARAVTTSISETTARGVHAQSGELLAEFVRVWRYCLIDTKDAT